MTDDLRTRAREAAYDQCANDEQGDAFIDGALWHAAGAELVNRRTR